MSTDQQTTAPRRLTLDEAAAAIGRNVTYHPGHGPVEFGIITHVGAYVFVLYKGDLRPKATDPAMLTLDGPR